MPNPRVRYDGNGEPRPCLVKVPKHLAKYLYGAALKARQGKGGLQVEESEIVNSLIKKWAESQSDLASWAEILVGLKAEDNAAKKAGDQTGPVNKAKQSGAEE